MTPFLARLAAVLCLTWVAAAPAAAQTGTIKGRIIDDQTGAALPGANVFLEKTSFSAASDERGDYALPKVPAAPMSLSQASSATSKRDRPSRS
jgi:hypothetical protein